ncbi:MAG: hypothetical protein IKD72_09450 [Clostridia bacterium]|nr:hypothetical protein [Clostridia bacterium]
MGWIRDKIKGWVGNVTNFIKKLFGIASPSKVFAGYGKFLTMGLGEGMEKSIGYATAAVKDTAAAMEKAFDPDLTAETDVSGMDVESSVKSTYSIFGNDRNKPNSWVDSFFDRLAELNAPIIL